MSFIFNNKQKFDNEDKKFKDMNVEVSKKIINESDSIILICNDSGEIIKSSDKTKQLFDDNIVNKNIDSLFNLSDNNFCVKVNKNLYYYRINSYNIDINDNLYIIYKLDNITNIITKKNEIKLYQKIINRVLRHNVRNEMNVIMGYANILSESVSDDYKEEAEIINNKVIELKDKLEKLRKMKSVIENNTFKNVDIYNKINLIINSNDYRSDINIRMMGFGNNYTIRVNPYIDYAVREIIENSIEHNNSDNKQLDIIFKENKEDIEIYFQDNGIGIKDNEIDVIGSWDETPHKHSSGSGLWLIKWIVTRSNGDVSFNYDDNGSEVKLRFNKKSKFVWLDDLI